jgi:hypothetical protein
MIRSSHSTIFLKVGSKAPLKKLSNLSLSEDYECFKVESEGLGLKLASRCLRALVGMRREQQLDNEL